eukprot:m51a1_g8043 hypothetical protein (143) ;mRNA; r:76896-79658
MAASQLASNIPPQRPSVGPVYLKPVEQHAISLENGEGPEMKDKADSAIIVLFILGYIVGIAWFLGSFYASSSTVESGDGSGPKERGLCRALGLLAVGWLVQVAWLAELNGREQWGVGCLAGFIGSLVLNVMFYLRLSSCPQP